MVPNTCALENQVIRLEAVKVSVCGADVRSASYDTITTPTAI